jgi:dTDP-D-glucose 4,6-dehydratase
MRFDLAINGMTYGAWKTGKLPLMRDGAQWRPMIHVADTARAQMFMLLAPRASVGGQIFNVGSARNCYQIGPLGELVARLVPKHVEIEWYGDPDERSYRVDFAKIEALGYRAERDAMHGVAEICEALQQRQVDRTTPTITLDWYKELVHWHQAIRSGEAANAPPEQAAHWRTVINQVEMYNGIVEISGGCAA